jgi:hypothetical protein
MRGAFGLRYQVGRAPLFSEGCFLRQHPRHDMKNALDLGAAADVASPPPSQEAAMPTEQQQTVHARTPIDDHDAIAAIVQMYIDGSTQGDAAKLTEGFHPDAQMYGAVGDDRYDEPITEYVKLMADSPGGETLRARITSIVQAGDAASATVVEDGFWGTLSFVTFLTLSRIEGRWRIVNKTFAHTGGEMPAEE